jgi:hypothetical protein
MLTDLAARRLAMYCQRSATMKRDSVERPYGHGVRHVSYTNEQLRELVWRDKEVRDVLLQDDLFGALADMLRRRGHERHYGDLLDLATAMSLEAETCEHPAA